MGGGSGGANMARGLVEALPEQDIVVIGGTWDDGGSTGKLKRHTPEGVGDLRRLIGAVGASAEVEAWLNTRFETEDVGGLHRSIKAFKQAVRDADIRVTDGTLDTVKATALRVGEDSHHRFQRGIYGHTLGNFMLAGLAAEQGIQSGVHTLGTAVGARATVLPAVVGPQQLELDDGGFKVYGEHAIDTYPIQHPFDARISFRRVVSPSTVAARALARAKMFVAAPGSPYTSIAPGLVAYRSALAEQAGNNGLFVGISNLYNNDHDTPGYRVSDYARVYGIHARRRLDIMFHNDNYDGLPPLIRDQHVERHTPDEGPGHPQMISGNYVGEPTTQSSSDEMLRTHVEHDSLAVVHDIGEILHDRTAARARRTMPLAS